MNLIMDRWLPVIRQDGAKEKIAIIDLFDQHDSNPVIDFKAYRPDFYHSLFQMFIGLVQVVMTPKSEMMWERQWHNPPIDLFKERLSQYADCFEIDSDGPAFMQDYEKEKVVVKKNLKGELKNLFLDIPANEPFRYIPKHLSPYWAVVALYCLQIGATGGGKGNRGSLRGLGYINNIIMPKYESPIWNQIWINILNLDELSDIGGDITKTEKGDIFPWMAKTKYSNTHSQTYPIERHPVYAFFSMPRRIRLVFEKNSCVCDISGEACDTSVSYYYNEPYGNYYTKENWRHPLTPYAKKKDMVPILINVVNIRYANWAELISESPNNHRSSVVQSLFNSAKANLEESFLLWSAGYESDPTKSMKCSCWHESTLPIYPLKKDQEKEFLSHSCTMINYARKALEEFFKSITRIWGKANLESENIEEFYKKLKANKKGLFSLSRNFWLDTEDHFYGMAESVIQNLDNREQILVLIKEWQQYIIQQIKIYFNRWCRQTSCDIQKISQSYSKLMNSLIRNMENE